MMLLLVLLLMVPIRVHGQCSEIECCPGRDDTCSSRGCFCDEACVNLLDCCPDYHSVCNANGGCGGNFDTKPGTIHSPAYPGLYPNNAFCTYVITARVGEIIGLTFTRFALEGGSTCPYDSVKIYDGRSVYGQEMERYCGTTIPSQMITSTGNVMTIVFRSDGSVIRSGFRANYVFLSTQAVGCGGNFNTGPETIHSPAHPGQYPNYVFCTYVIQATVGEIIGLTFTRFEVEGGNGCPYDSVTIYDGSVHGQQIERLCGDTISPQMITSTGTLMTVVFQTDGSVKYSGFRGNYVFLSNQTDVFTDCQDVYNAGVRSNGVYTIKPTNWLGSAFNVYCNMTGGGGGGWTVFQRRMDGIANFYLGWQDYRDGFGDVTAEHWLGNEKLHYLTNQRDYQLRVDLVDEDGHPWFAIYSLFRIANENDNYRLTHIGSHWGNAGDAMTYSLNKRFSTKDRDNDVSALECAEADHGAWWYGSCTHANLNGDYHHAEGLRSGERGFCWRYIEGHDFDDCRLKYSEMKVRPV